LGELLVEIMRIKYVPFDVPGVFVGPFTLRCFAPAIFADCLVSLRRRSFLRGSIGEDDFGKVISSETKRRWVDIESENSS
jgi:hypothetical protein